MIKLIVSDMDGTLLGLDHEMMEENVRTIKEAQALGKQFMVATGRNYDNVKIMLEDQGLHVRSILMNGAQYRDENGNIIRSIGIMESVLREIIPILLNHDVAFEMVGEFQTFTMRDLDYTYEAFVGHAKKHGADQFKSVSEAFPKDRFISKLRYIDDLQEAFKYGLILKLDIFSSNEEEIEKLRVILTEREELSVTNSFGDNIEVTSCFAQKAFMLRYVLDDLKVGKDEVMVLGDGANDISMLASVSHSFAMENAAEHVKVAASYVAEHHAKAGVSKAIKKMIPELL